MSTITQEQLVKVTNILEQLDEHPLPDRSTNRRHSCRTTIRTSLKVLLLQGGTPAPVDIFSRNISLSGMGFVCRRMFKPDERLAISLLIPKLPPKLILARITFSRYIRNSLHEMGAEFLECINDPTGKSCIPLRWLVTSGSLKTALPSPPAAEAPRPSPRAATP